MDGGKRVRRGGCVASLALVATAVPTGLPGRAFTCSFDPATGTAQVHMAAGDYPTISADANGLRLRPAGGKNHCNGTPLADVRRIAVTTEPGAQSKLWVELSAVDPTGAIAFDVDLGSDGVIVWSSIPGNAVFGRDRADLNGDGTAESTVRGIGSTFPYASATGRHTISANGGGAVGPPLEGYVEIRGGNDGDTLIGSPVRDLIVAGSGDDTIRGLGGDDIVLANGGDDLIDGGDGADELNADAGADHVLGRAGNDVITVRDGEADTVNGGSGNDTAYTDDLDHLRHVERINPG